MRQVTPRLRRCRWFGAAAAATAALALCLLECRGYIRSEKLPSGFVSAQSVRGQGFALAQPAVLGQGTTTPKGALAADELRPTTTLSATCILAAAYVGAITGARLVQLRRGRRAQSTRRQGTGAVPGAGGAIDTFLLRGPVDASTLAAKCAPFARFFDLECMVFLSCGVDAAIVAKAAGGALGLHGVCPVFIAECQGVIGWDPDAKANAEMFEESGSGESGIVVAAFRGGCHEPSCVAEAATANQGLPEGRALHLVVRAAGVPSTPPSGMIYGGIAKACYQLEHSGDLKKVSQFSISTPFAVLSAFDRRDAGEVASECLSMLPPPATPPIAIGYFSCPSRGRNKYGEDGVEAAAIAKQGLGGIRMFGMYAEVLGPPADTPPIPCVPELTEWTSIMDADPRPALELHSSASVLALYGK